MVMVTSTSLTHYPTRRCSALFVKLSGLINNSLRWQLRQLLKLFVIWQRKSGLRLRSDLHRNVRILGLWQLGLLTVWISRKWLFTTCHNTHSFHTNASKNNEWCTSRSEEFFSGMRHTTLSAAKSGEKLVAGGGRKAVLTIDQHRSELSLTGGNL